MRLIVAATLCLTSWFAFGVEGIPGSNVLCPVMPDEKAEADLFVDYHGQRIYMCCKKCRPKFEKDPEKYLAEFKTIEPAFVMTESADHQQSPASGAPPQVPAPASTVTPPQPPRHPEPTGFARLIRWLGQFHPAMVHFPIALLMVAAGCLVMSRWSSWQRWGETGRLSLALGALGGALATALGWANWWFQKFSSTDTTPTLHLWFGTAAGIVGMLAWIAQTWSDRSRARQRHAVALITVLIAAALVGIAGYFGACLVYGDDHLAW